MPSPSPTATSSSTTSYLQKRAEEEYLMEELLADRALLRQHQAHVAVNQEAQAVLAEPSQGGAVGPSDSHVWFLAGHVFLALPTATCADLIAQQQQALDRAAQETRARLATREDALNRLRQQQADGRGRLDFSQLPLS
ncbi:hypothetical protein CXG81DRAFT_25682 [Caulochytrium protostelioides]|uniref:P53 and DNA damage-regulated protein 1 n=1 Tax=Caulochytrium protostelioides TaxID=1555241 RepID=A0A4P9X8P8_9FUNG|nr:hypothetical protein CXG81DRAFT_25682 [Caulochytrium protostelioides]|eukprot:RKP01648.1 hypothetical protein CXG81DRAFT_25682 [Caulochytrium protostelioides]